MRSDGSQLWCGFGAANINDEFGDLTTRVAITDINERMQAQSRLRRKAAALKAVSQGVIITTPDQLIVTVNAAFLAITGYSEAEVLGRNCKFLQGPDTDQQTVAEIRTALLQRRDFDGEILNCRKNGQPFWNALTISPVFDERGVLSHFVGVTRDITESKLTRQALEKSYVDLQRTSEILELTGALSKIGGWEVNLQTMKLTWTRETFRIAAMDLLIEPSLEEGINLFAPEARPTISAAVQAAIDTGMPYDLELPLISADGRHKWVRTQGFAEMRIGKTVRIYGTFQDITARMASQKALGDMGSFVRTIVDTVPGLLAYWGTDFTCRFANSAYTEWFGRTPEEMSGIAMKDLLGETVFQKNEPYIRAVLSGENQQFERELTKPNGEVGYTWAQYIAHWKGGEVAGFLALVTDISEVKKAQQSLQLSLHEKQALLKEVHHRVKNNLQVISSLLRLEARQSTLPESVDVLKAMQGRIQTMAQLHESLYRSGTFASIDLGKYLGQIATQAFQTHLVRDMPVQLKLDLASLQVGMDQALACGLLVNELISNSLKHAFPGSRSGQVCCDLQPLNPTSVQTDAPWQLRVSDTGVGLPPDFESKRTTSLGLQLVDDFSQQAGGTMTIQSQPGLGAQFSVILRALKPEPLVMRA